jgi:hypothetical protein
VRVQYQFREKISLLVDRIKEDKKTRTKERLRRLIKYMRVQIKNYQWPTIKIDFQPQHNDRKSFTLGVK